MGQVILRGFLTPESHSKSSVFPDHLPAISILPIIQLIATFNPLRLFFVMFIVPCPSHHFYPASFYDPFYFVLQTLWIIQSLLLHCTQMDRLKSGQTLSITAKSCLHF